MRNFSLGFNILGSYRLIGINIMEIWQRSNDGKQKKRTLTHILWIHVICSVYHSLNGLPVISKKCRVFLRNLELLQVNMVRAHVSAGLCLGLCQREVGSILGVCPFASCVLRTDKDLWGQGRATRVWGGKAYISQHGS